MKSESVREITDEQTFGGQRRCSAVNKHGKPCGSPPPFGQSICIQHGPQGEEIRAKARVASAEARAERKRTRSLSLRDHISAAAEENAAEIVEALLTLLRSKNEGTRANAVSMLLDRQLGKPRTDSSPVVLEQPHYATREEALALVAALKGNGGSVQAGD